MTNKIIQGEVFLNNFKLTSGDDPIKKIIDEFNSRISGYPSLHFFLNNKNIEIPFSIDNYTVLKLINAIDDNIQSFKIGRITENELNAFYIDFKLEISKISSLHPYFIDKLFDIKTFIELN